MTDQSNTAIAGVSPKGPGPRAARKAAGKPNRVEQRLILLLLAVFVLRGLIYATVVPLWNAPDEPSHYQYAEVMAKRVSPSLKTDLFYGDRLAYSGRSTGYYWLAGMLGVLPMSGGGLVARGYALRLLSILLSAGVVYFTYRMAKDLFPQDRFVYFGAPMIVTMLPMYTFTGMSINSDNLAVILFTLFLWLSIRVMVAGVDLIGFFLLILSAGLGWFTKRTTLVSGLLLSALPLFFIFRKPAESGMQRAVRVVVAFAAATGIIGSLLLVARMALSFDRLNAASAAGGITSLANLASEEHRRAMLDQLIISFWGSFGWLDAAVPPERIALLQRIWLLPVAGYIYICAKSIQNRHSLLTRPQVIGLLFLVGSIFSVVVVVFVYGPVLAPTGLTWMPQARYAWTALGAGAVVCAVGLIKAVSLIKGIGGWAAKALFSVLAVSMFVYDLSLLRTIVIPRYFASFWPGEVLLRDPMSNLSPRLFEALRYYALSDDAIRALLTDRPALLSSRLFFTVLFALYIGCLAAYVFWAASGQGQEAATGEATSN